ncbi:MAG TPA: class I SAM-dependent methyltransferase [Anaerolineales bacterium]|jgi:ubiquinone/menaquinone biosynthesis C-methylase UbiE|nr:class I SAM-dependent methyltransferase [Anaerolineales bacterium]
MNAANDFSSLDDHLASVAEAFSHKAHRYDEFGRDHINLERMRRKVRQHVLPHLKPGDSILELNAGTGSDAVFFAQRGYEVLATDISPRMLARIRDKVVQYGLDDRIAIQQCSFTDLGQIQSGPFDYVFSNMGGINCFPDPGEIISNLPGLLRPGGHVTWVVMPPICPWEIAMILRADLKTALRRLSPKGTLANVEGVRFTTYYFSPNQIIQAFGTKFQPIQLQGLSVFTPPADRKEFPTKFPRLYRFLVRMDENLADHPPFNHWGDFYILTLRYLS